MAWHIVYSSFRPSPQRCWAGYLVRFLEAIFCNFDFEVLGSFLAGIYVSLILNFTFLTINYVYMRWNAFLTEVAILFSFAMI
jgi:hypothetical protein